MSGLFIILGFQVGNSQYAWVRARDFMWNIINDTGQFQYPEVSVKLRGSWGSYEEVDFGSNEMVIKLFIHMFQSLREHYNGFRVHKLDHEYFSYPYHICVDCESVSLISTCDGS